MRREEPVRIQAPAWRLYAALFASSVSFVAGTVLARSVMPEIGASGASAWRMMAGLLILAVQPPRVQMSLRNVGVIVSYGLALGAMNLSFYCAIRTVSIGVAMAIQFTGPLAVAAFSSRRPQDLIWPALAFGGLLLLLPISSLSTPIDPVGAAWACAAAGFWAIYMLIGKATAQLPLGATVGFGMLSAALVIVPIGVIEAGPLLFSTKICFAGTGVAVLSAMAYCLEMVALRGLSRRTFGVLINFEPVLAAIAAFLAFGQVLTHVQWSAMLAIIVACIGSILAGRIAGSASQE